jgi:hypothetical protein
MIIKLLHIVNGFPTLMDIGLILKHHQSVTIGDIPSVTSVLNDRTYVKGKYVKQIDKQANVLTQPSSL